MAEPPKLYTQLASSSVPIFIFLVVFFILMIIIYYVQYDNLAKSLYMYPYFTVFFAILAFGIFLSNSYSKTRERVSLIFSFSFFAFVLFVAVICIHFHYIYSAISQSYLAYLLVFFIIVNAFTIFYNVLKNSSYPINTTLFSQFIFYIPCLISEFIEFIGSEFKTTPNVVFILFIVELVLILLYLYVPVFLKKISKMNRVEIMGNSKFLDKEHIILNNSAVLQVTNPDNQLTNQLNQLNQLNTVEKSVNRSFAISFWVYISSPDKRDETNVFNYSHHPKVAFYRGNTEEAKDNFIIYFTNVKPDETAYKFSAPQQRWNYIVVNYNDTGICDLFLNGVLTKSMDIGKYSPMFHYADNMTIGEENGLYGSVSNVSYYKKTMTLNEIITTYNLLSLKNPPEL